MFIPWRHTLNDEIEKQESTKQHIQQYFIANKSTSRRIQDGFFEDTYDAIDHSKSFTNTTITGLTVSAPLSNDISYQKIRLK